MTYEREWRKLHTGAATLFIHLTTRIMSTGQVRNRAHVREKKKAYTILVGIHERNSCLLTPKYVVECNVKI